MHDLSFHRRVEPNIAEGKMLLIDTWINKRLERGKKRKLNRLTVCIVSTHQYCQVVVVTYSLSHTRGGLQKKIYIRRIIDAHEEKKLIEDNFEFHQYSLSPHRHRVNQIQEGNCRKKIHEKDNRCARREETDIEANFEFHQCSSSLHRLFIVT